MSVFEIEQYELHVMKYRAPASNEAEAIAKVLNGEAEPVQNGLEYVEVADCFGLPVDEHRQLAKDLHAFGVQVSENVIPSIRSVEEVK